MGHFQMCFIFFYKVQLDTSLGELAKSEFFSFYLFQIFENFKPAKIHDLISLDNLIGVIVVFFAMVMGNLKFLETTEALRFSSIRNIY